MGQGRQADVQFGRSRSKRAVAWPRGEGAERMEDSSLLWHWYHRPWGSWGEDRPENQVMEEAGATDREG